MQGLSVHGCVSSRRAETEHHALCENAITVWSICPVGNVQLQPGSTMICSTVSLRDFNFLIATSGDGAENDRLLGVQFLWRVTPNGRTDPNQRRNYTDPERTGRALYSNTNTGVAHNKLSTWTEKWGFIGQTDAYSIATVAYWLLEAYSSHFLINTKKKVAFRHASLVPGFKHSFRTDLS